MLNEASCRHCGHSADVAARVIVLMEGQQRGHFALQMPAGIDQDVDPIVANQPGQRGVAEAGGVAPRVGERAEPPGDVVRRNLVGVTEHLDAGMVVAREHRFDERAHRMPAEIRRHGDDAMKLRERRRVIAVA